MATERRRCKMNNCPNEAEAEALRAELRATRQKNEDYERVVQKRGKQIDELAADNKRLREYTEDLEIKIEAAREAKRIYKERLRAAAEGATDA